MKIRSCRVWRSKWSLTSVNMFMPCRGPSHAVKVKRTKKEVGDHPDPINIPDKGPNPIRSTLHLHIFKKLLRVGTS